MGRSVPGASELRSETVLLSDFLTYRAIYRCVTDLSFPGPQIPWCHVSPLLSLDEDTGRDLNECRRWSRLCRGGGPRLPDEGN